VIFAEVVRKFRHPLQKTTVHRRVHNSFSLVSITYHMNPIHTLIPSFQN